MHKNILPLREHTTHGSLSFPFASYSGQSQRLPAYRPFLCSHHWHEEIEILYFEKGTFLVEVGMDRYPVDRECFFFINSTEMHAIRSFTEYREYAAVFQPSILEFAFSDASQQDIIRPVIANELTFPRCIRSGDRGFDEIRGLFRILMDVSDPDPCHPADKPWVWNISPCGQLCIKAALLNILAVLDREKLFTSDTYLPDHRVEILKSSITYMKEHYQDKIYISDLSALANMNEQYYCRFFKKAIGVAPIRYLNDYRIRKSMELLRTTDKPVLDISVECGFNNLGNYMRSFRNLNHTTPLQYRKASQNVNIS